MDAKRAMDLLEDQIRWRCVQLRESASEKTQRGDDMWAKQLLDLIDEIHEAERTLRKLVDNNC